MCHAVKVHTQTDTGRASIRHCSRLARRSRSPRPCCLRIRCSRPATTPRANFVLALENSRYERNHRMMTGQETRERMQATEPHYSTQQVADMWSVSRQTVQCLFDDVPGVLKISMPRLLTHNPKRKPRVSLSIPATVLEQVHREQARGFRLEVKRHRGGI